MPGPVKVVTGWYSWDYSIGPDLRAGGLRDSTPREVMTWNGPKGREDRDIPILVVLKAHSSSSTGSRIQKDTD